jgi:hypothetical protein
MAGREVELEIRKSPLAKTTLRVTPDAVQWGERRIELGDVQHVAVYGHEITMNFVWAGGRTQFWFADSQGEALVPIPDTRAPNDRRTVADATEALWQAVFGTVAPRLVDELAGRIGQGEAVDLGGDEVLKAPTAGIPGMVARWQRGRKASTLVVDRRTVELRGETSAKASWPLAEVDGATIEEGQVRIIAAGKKTALLPTTYRDVVLLPQLLDRLKVV